MKILGIVSRKTYKSVYIAEISGEELKFLSAGTGCYRLEVVNDSGEKCERDPDEFEAGDTLDAEEVKERRGRIDEMASTVRELKRSLSALKGAITKCNNAMGVSGGKEEG